MTTRMIVLLLSVSVLLAIAWVGWGRDLYDGYQYGHAYDQAMARIATQPDITIEADVVTAGSWSGNFDGRTVEGRGTQAVALDLSARRHCATVQKGREDDSPLTLTIRGRSQTTTARFGVVTVCD